MLGLARRQLRRSMAALKPYLDQGFSVVGLNPAVVAVFRDELLGLFPSDPDAKRTSASFLLLSEFLERIDFQPPSLEKRAIVQGHCHQQAIMKMTSARKSLEADETSITRCWIPAAVGWPVDSASSRRATRSR